MNRRQLPDDTPTDTPTEKSLIRLHRQVRCNRECIRMHRVLLSTSFLHVTYYINIVFILDHQGVADATTHRDSMGHFSG